VSAKYDRQLTDAEIEAKEHREFVGGLWAELGALQFEFLRGRGLRPEHRFLDVGCGALRAGLHFIRYLERGHYFGLDRNASLLKAGRVELEEAGLSDRQPLMLDDGVFDAARFGTTFHLALAQSVFTHLELNSVARCLAGVAAVLEPGGRFFASYFPAPSLHHYEGLPQLDGRVSYADRFPFHYPFAVFPFLASELPLQVHDVGPWGHPRGQYMVEFVRL
jgi:SAM-dependent methyltransferase